MKQVAPHCVVTAKAGSTTAIAVWKDIQVPGKDYKFLQARNPYHRFVSTFIFRFAMVNGNRAVRAGVALDNYPAREKADLEQQVRATFGLSNEQGTRNESFRSVFYKFVQGKQLGDDHVAPQTKKIIPTNDIILLHNLPEAYLIPAKALGIELDLSTVPYLMATKKDDTIDWSKYNVPDLTVEEWWNLGGAPSDYSLFYDEQLLSDVYNEYKDDFDYLGIEKGEM